MHRNVKVALGGAALSLGVVVGLPTAALADPTIDCSIAEIAAKYAEICAPVGGEVPDNEEQPVVGGGGGSGTGGGSTGGGTAGGSAGGGVASQASSLPFTGDEILVLSLVGAAALAGGTALTVAGRRRGATTA